MANSTWSPTDKTANVTLSGGNLIATSSSSGAWVRATDGKTTGKFYWEVTGSTWTNGQTGIGITTATATPTPWNATGLFVVATDGFCYLNGTSAFALGQGSMVNAPIGFALDVGAKLVWVRKSPSGNWNQSTPGANPATGVGGSSLAAIGAGALHPVAELAAASEVANANFGDTAFSGAVPSGYTAGWPSAAVTAATQARVMVMT